MDEVDKPANPLWDEFRCVHMRAAIDFSCCALFQYAPIALRSAAGPEEKR